MEERKKGGEQNLLVHPKTAKLKNMSFWHSHDKVKDHLSNNDILAPDSLVKPVMVSHLLPRAAICQQLHPHFTEEITNLR